MSVMITGDSVFADTPAKIENAPGELSDSELNLFTVPEVLDIAEQDIGITSLPNPSASGSHSGHSREEANSVRANHKRKKGWKSKGRGTENGDDGEGGDGHGKSEGNGRKRRPVVRRDADPTEDYVACPYYALEPLYYCTQREFADYGTCAKKPGFDTLGKLMRHMLNVHYAIYCDRCYRQFDEERLLEQHKQREAECDIQPPRQLEGLNKEECVVILRKMNTRRAADRTWAWAFGMAWPEYPTNRYPTERYEHRPPPTWNVVASIFRDEGHDTDAILRRLCELYYGGANEAVLERRRGHQPAAVTAAEAEEEKEEEEEAAAYQTTTSLLVEEIHATRVTEVTTRTPDSSLSASARSRSSSNPATLLPAPLIQPGPALPSAPMLAAGPIIPPGVVLRRQGPLPHPGPVVVQPGGVITSVIDNLAPAMDAMARTCPLPFTDLMKPLRPTPTVPVPRLARAHAAVAGNGNWNGDMSMQQCQRQRQGVLPNLNGTGANAAPLGGPRNPFGGRGGPFGS